ncbi:MAG TPA: DUF881 domain-containing protein [Pseudonocardiaceae bacterium]|nr:DUF881 domain-containing protein [Pseudonocardiaceae bacterium]
MAGRSRHLATALIAVLCLLLGVAIATQVRRTMAGDTLADQRPQDLVVLLDGLQQREAALRKQIADAEAALERLRSSGDSSAAALAEAQRRAQALAVLAGTVPATGPGLHIQITDEGGDVGPEDLLDALQELRGAGAEAVQIGGVRVGVDSAFTGEAGAVVLDGSRLNPPLRVLVIGDPPTLAAALNIPGGVVDTIERAGGGVQIEQADQVQITALRMLRTPQYARPAG